MVALNDIASAAKEAWLQARKVALMADEGLSGPEAERRAKSELEDKFPSLSG